MPMIRLDDNPFVAIHICYEMWSIHPLRNIQILPKIPDHFSLDELKGFMNAKLFESGFLNSRVYRARYRLACDSPGKDAPESRRKLEEMFCGTEWTIPIIGSN